ncbi:hypothetical protein [Actinoplanes ianthinogenes]|nr:hypothetical protein [Actinoplanes ianthinogenes]
MADDEYDPQPQGSLYASAAAVAPSRRSLRRRQAVVAVAGAAALLAGGAFLGTQLIEVQQPTLPEPAALAPQTPPSPSAPPTEEPPPQLGAKPTLSAARAKLSPMPSPSLDADELAASEAADGFLQHLAPASPGTADQQVTERIEATRDGSIRVTTARYDLSGRGQLSLLADQGTMVGSAHCTNRVRFSAGAAAAERPHLMLCWRTSPTRSVVTMAVNRDSRPAATASVAVLEREWAALD